MGNFYHPLVIQSPQVMRGGDYPPPDKQCHYHQVPITEEIKRLVLDRSRLRVI